MDNEEKVDLIVTFRVGLIIAWVLNGVYQFYGTFSYSSFFRELSGQGVLILIITLVFDLIIIGY